MWNPPCGAILPVGLEKGGGLAVICDLLAGALTGGRTHSPRTIKKAGTDIINNNLSSILEPAPEGGPELFGGQGETLIPWGKTGQAPARGRAGLAPGEARRP